MASQAQPTLLVGKLISTISRTATLAKVVPHCAEADRLPTTSPEENMRNLFRTSAYMSLALALIVSLSAAAQASTAPQDRQSRTEKPSQSQPAPDNGTVQGSQTPSQTPAASDTQNTPPAQAAPQSQTNSGSDAQAGRAPGQGATIEDELQLTPDQKQKIASVVDEENKQIVAVRDDASLSTDQKMQKVQEIRKVGAPKIKAILTPEQLQKLAAIQERARQQQNNQAAPPKQ